jgi:hypothetical protein
MLFAVPSARAVPIALLLVSAFVFLGLAVPTITAKVTVHSEPSKRLGTRLILQATTTAPTFGDSITLFGTINITSHVSIFILIQSQSPTINQTVSAEGGTFSYLWTPAAADSYNVTAVWNGDGTHNPATSSLEIGVARESTTISLSPLRVNSTVGTPVPFIGTLSPAVPEAVVTITITPPNLTRSISTLQTYSNGSFRFLVLPSQMGIWTVTASWPGDENHLGAQSANSIVTANSAVDGGWNPAIIVAVITIPLSLAVVFFVYKYARTPIQLPIGQILKRRAPPHLRPLRVLNGAICPICFRPMNYEPKGADWHCEHCGVYYESL